MLLDYGISRTSEPLAEILSASEAREHCRVDGAEEDAYLASLVKAAARRIEDECSLSLVSQGWELELDGFPEWDIDLPRSPVLSVASVSYTDADGDEQTLSTDDYEASLPRGIVRPSVAAGSWPATDGSTGCVRVAFTAGYGTDAADVPEPLRQACRMIVAHWHRHRESVATGGAAELPQGAQWLLDPYRAGRYA